MTGNQRLQYYRPADEDRFIGSPIPFVRDRTLHLYYQTACRPDAVADAAGCREWGHLSTSDLCQWEEHPPALTFPDAAAESACGMRNGSIIEHDDRIYAVMAVHDAARKKPSEHVVFLVSDDLAAFKVSDDHRCMAAPDGYSSRNFRDPCVFRDDLGLFHLLVATERTKDSRPPVARGCLAHFTSLDLKSWKQEETLMVPGYPSVPECPDYFQWHDWYYLTFQHRGQLHYRMSRAPFGPWQTPAVDTLDGPLLNNAKTFAFDDDQRYLVGYLRWADTDDDPGSRLYGGNCVLRELQQQPDGQLFACLPDKLQPLTQAPLRLSVWSVVGNVDVIERDVVIMTPGSIGVARCNKRCPQGRIHCRIGPQGPPQAYGLWVRAGGAMKKGYEIRFLPTAQLVSIRNLDDLAGRSHQLSPASVFGVEQLDQPFELELFMCNDILDLSINRRRTLVARFPDWRNDEVYLFCNCGTVAFRDLTIAPLQP